MSHWDEDTGLSAREKHWDSWSNRSQSIASPRINNFVSAGVFTMAALIVAFNGAI